MALEPRLMFDGAAAMDAVHAVAVSTVADVHGISPPVTVREADPAANGGRKEVAFVETSVNNYRTLEAGIRAGVEIVEIGGGENGLAQMAAWAETHSGYDAVFVLSHGSAGGLDLGSRTLTTDDLSDRRVQDELAHIGQALTAGGDILFYGCSVDADGGAFIRRIAALTGADIAASTDATGAAHLGGDWDLENRTGAIEASGIEAKSFEGLLATESVSATGTTNATWINAGAVVVDANVTVTNSGSNITDGKVVIAANLTSGDTLSATGTGGLTVTGYTSSTGVLTITGTGTAAEWQAVFRSVTFSATSQGSGDRTITFSLGSGVALNNHYYEGVNAGGAINWTAAKTAAEARTYMGLQGYLASITSSSENAFITQKLTANAWIGATDDVTYTNAYGGYGGVQANAEGHFYWASGPNAGTAISDGNTTPAAAGGAYMNWASGEPNNWGGSEGYGQIYYSSGGTWNDLANAPGTVSVYVVEYGGSGGDPAVTLSASRTVSVAASSGTAATTVTYPPPPPEPPKRNPFGPSYGPSPYGPYGPGPYGPGPYGPGPYGPYGPGPYGPFGGPSYGPFSPSFGPFGPERPFGPPPGGPPLGGPPPFSPPPLGGPPELPPPPEKPPELPPPPEKPPELPPPPEKPPELPPPPEKPPELPPPPEKPPELPPPPEKPPELPPKEPFVPTTQDLPKPPPPEQKPPPSDADAPAKTAAQPPSGFPAPTGNAPSAETATPVVGPLVGQERTVASPTTFQVAIVERVDGKQDALVVKNPVPDLALGGDSRFSYSIPADAFAHTKADTKVTLIAQQYSGEPLPAWMTFNPQTGTFEGTPPPGLKGEVVVKVVARDGEGREATQSFKFVVGEGGEGAVSPTGDAGPKADGARVAASSPGRAGLAEQIRNQGREGRGAAQMAFVKALKRAG